MAQYSTLAKSKFSPREGYLFEVGSLWEYLSRLHDRRDARGKVYALATVLVMIILAKLSGEDSLRGITEWLAERQDELVMLLALRRPRTPSRATLTRLLASVVSVKHLEQLLGAFLQSLPQSGMRVVVAIDGKTLRGTITAQQPRGVHLLAAYLPQQGLVLFQLEVSRQHNEIPVAARLLKALDLRGKVVTADALLTQRHLCLQIVEAGGEYVLRVKLNQPQLYGDIQQLFHDPPVRADFRTAQRLGKGHGRIEVRRLTVSSLLAGYSPWPHLAQVFRVVRRVVCLGTGRVSEEILYGLTSLTAAEISPAELLTIFRLHWGIENGLHYRRDVTLGEDRSRVRTGQAPQALAAINNLVLSLIAQAGFQNARHARRHLAAHLDRAFGLTIRQLA